MPNINRHEPGTFCWFELATTDQHAAKQFYTSQFGWSVNDFPMGPNQTYSMFQLQGRDVGAAYTLRPEQQSQGIPPHWLLYVAVENADRTAEKATQLGAKIYASPFDVFNFGRMAVIGDPTGAVFAIWQAREHHGTGIAGVDGTVCWADLNTREPEKARAFYSDLFGWQFTKSEQDSSGYLHLKNGNEFIGGIPPVEFLNPNAPPHWLLYFQVSDCNGSAQRAQSTGAQFLMPPTDIEKVGRIAIIKDPQNAVFALYQAAQQTAHQ